MHDVEYPKIFSIEVKPPSSKMIPKPLEILWCKIELQFEYVHKEATLFLGVR